MKKINDFVPEWAKDAIWYQVFPDRFNNGDTSNDPAVETLENAWPHDFTSPWQVHPWTSDWYELQPWEKENGKDIWFNIQRRRYGGDIQGIIDKLPYLQELGVNALYLNPVFESPSLHKYDAATYHHIDPNFGPDPEGDREKIKSEIPDNPSTWVWTEADKLFLKFLNEAHNRGFRVIIDGVFNHMGLNSWAFRDVVKNQEKSKYKDWFKIISFDDPEVGTEFSYTGWYGVRELPELNQDKNGITEGPKKYIFDITERWMAPNGDTSAGIDGWRLDVAFMVKHPFWKEWRKHVKSINPEAYITAEIIDSVEYNKPYLKGDEFDAVMNYNFAFAADEFFIKTDSNKITVTEFDERLRYLREAYPECVAYVQQNLYDSHDSNRLLSHLVNNNLALYRDWPAYFGSSRGDNPAYNTGKPGKEHIKIMKLMALFQMTYLGAPMIYYGDEAGMWGANDPCSRKPMVWPDKEYRPEKLKPDQTKYKKPGKVEFNDEIFEHYKKLTKIRKEHSALRNGSFETILTDNEDDVYVFTRENSEDAVIVVINNSNEEVLVDLETDSENDFDELMTGKEYPGTITLQVAAKEGRILVNK